MAETKPLRIFQILEKNEFNTGSVHQMFQAAVGLHERGNEVTIISRPGTELEQRARDAGVAFYAFPFRSDLDFRTIRGLSRLVRERRPDVIHVHKGRSHSLALMASWTRPAGAFVVNRGVSFDLKPWNRGKYQTPRVDRIVTVCQQIKDVIVSTGRVPDEKVTVVYAGTDMRFFDPAKWDPAEFRSEKSIPRDAFLITQVGIRDWKGWRELIDAASDVARVHPRIHLALVAYHSEAEAEQVRAYARAAGIGDKVTPVEPRADMPRLFAASDLVTDASWAGTGITGTIREAMAMRKPVIATDCGGNVELVKSPEVGWLIPAKDRPALVAAILEVIEHPDRAALVAQQGMDLVRNGFSKEHRLDQLSRIYREILESKLKIEN